MIDQWITIDRTYRIHFWDLATRERSYVLQHNILSKGYYNIIEMDDSRAVAIAVPLNQVTIWDFHEKQLLITINLPHSSLRNIKYSSKFQLLVSFGLDDKIILFNQEDI
jgi:hypothetical protein